eukprot:TRINITY_DN2745_c0_g1_i1.p1 TRINITY_DN2745_c0_g1~~TRINITY_DN2745_c0_g1_i1.p1  ORF type:complete len:396 (-),score=66.25 TRINITY_DN2745_c0_g1_i1:1140-2159(-)
MSIKAYQDFFAHKKTSMLREGVGGGDEEETKEMIEERKSNYETVVNLYYNLVTDFYEYGWGKSFHFACRYKGEGLQESIKRHEHYLAQKIGLKEGMEAVDLGCGVGGPLLEISRFTGASIVGINNNAYQVSRGLKYVKEAELDKKCTLIKGDFLNIPMNDEVFDAAYTIEACCHAPDRSAVFKEVYRVLKPGGVFAGYEWVMTDNYDPKNEKHVAIKKGIELGNGLPDLAPIDHVMQSLKDVGFEVIEHGDRAVKERESDIEWYDPLAGKWSISNFRTTKLGQFLTHSMLVALEAIHAVPKGCVATHLVLAEGADRLVEGGKLNLFTPMYLFVVRKPLK